MITESCFSFREDRTRRRARFESESDFFKLGIEAAPSLPSQRATLPSFVLGILSRYIIKLGAIPEFSQGFFLLRVLLTLERAE